MIDPDVRRAEPADVEQLDWLEAEARRALTTQRGGERWLETHPSRSARWPDVVACDDVFVAHIGEVLVGYLVLSVDGDLAIVEDVFVVDGARELGFGDELLAAAVAHGRSVGCRVLEGESLPGDRDTKNLYERAGIKARLITVSSPL